MTVKSGLDRIGTTPSGEADGAKLDALMPLVAAFYAHFSYRYDAASHRAMVEAVVVTPALGAVWLIGHPATGKYAGYVALTYGFSFEFGGRSALIDEIYVVPPARGLGLGAQAVGALQRKLPALGIHSLHLQTEHGNSRARRLYEALGFRVLPRDVLAYLPPR